MLSALRDSSHKDSGNRVRALPPQGHTPAAGLQLRPRLTAHFHVTGLKLLAWLDTESKTE